MRTELHYLWYGIWTGFGVEISFGLLWGVSRLLHSQFAKDLHPEHWVHQIIKYFD